MIKLHLDDLSVTTFDVSPDGVSAAYFVAVKTEPVTDPQDPTPATGCFDCPRATERDCA